MLELKNYQARCLEELERFFTLAGQVGAKRAFIELTERPYKAVKHFPDLPYACLRIPTGGGKTLMASHSVGIAARHYLQSENSVCLWLVPTNTIREQTLSALKDRTHPYREALANAVSTPIAVLDLSEALNVQAGTLSGSTVVIVATLAALRVADTEGRKVYESAGALQHHFTHVDGSLEALLERNSDGTLPYSLANVLRLHRPIVVMDEAHNARTPLSFDTLARVNPSCVIEFTATPETLHDPENDRFASNVLCHVSAAELKIEDMVKLPIRLHTRPDWREVISEALAAREQLETIANAAEQASGEYIRPIVLLQAQPKSSSKDTINAEVLRQHLIDDCKVPEDRIAVATGESREIDDVDLFSRDCRIRFIITVAALKEGWDCSFAYVLCSVADIGSARSVEQLLGRILRMPYAQRKPQDELNMAYAFAASQRFMDAATSLKDALVENGFERIEADQLVVSSTSSQPTLFGDKALLGETVQVVPETPNLDVLPGNLRQRVTFDETAGTLTVVGSLNSDDAKSLEGAFTTIAGKDAARQVFAASRGKLATPAKGERTIAVPWLMIRRGGGQLELFEDQFLDFTWKLSDCDFTLAESEFPTMGDAGQVGQLDVTKEGRVEVQFAQHLRRQLQLVGVQPGWDLYGLANWLDRNIPHPDITPVESRLFIVRALEHLQADRKVSVEQLAQEKYRLRDSLATRIGELRQQVTKQSWQRVLFESGDAVVTDSPETSFHFTRENYAPNWYYDGGYHWQKHLFDVIGELKSEGEEFECATILDQLPEVRWWVRNIERRPESSFWLQTSTDRFYPDFIALLTDGRRLVVEYKGKDRWSNEDSHEKRQLGELWASASGGKCLFIMPKGPDWNTIMAAVKAISFTK